MRQALLAALAIASLLSGCMAPADMSSSIGNGPPGPFWRAEAPPAPPVALAPVGIPMDLNNDNADKPASIDLGPVNPTNDDDDNPPPAPVHPRHHHRQWPVTAQPDEPEPSPPVADQPPVTPSEPDQPSLSDRLRGEWRSLFGGLSAPSSPSNSDECTGAWRICHLF